MLTRKILHQPDGFFHWLAICHEVNPGLVSRAANGAGGDALEGHAEEYCNSLGKPRQAPTQSDNPRRVSGWSPQNGGFRLGLPLTTAQKRVPTQQKDEPTNNTATESHNKGIWEGYDPWPLFSRHGSPHGSEAVYVCIVGLWS